MEENKKLDEKQLEEIVGGSDNGPNCYFTPTGETRNDGSYLVAKCASNCFGFYHICSCHGEEHCVNKWHRLLAGTGELEPQSFANHENKPKSNNYNT